MGSGLRCHTAGVTSDFWVVVVVCVWPLKTGLIKTSCEKKRLLIRVLFYLPSQFKIRAQLTIS